MHVIEGGVVGEAIEWNRLLQEFEGFQPEPLDLQWNGQDFVRALEDPLPDFVEHFLAKKFTQGWDIGAAVRALYCFLLEKRYSERLNLLHFAFRIFDDESSLPQPVIDRTPFPHEDGLPSFRCINECGFKIGPGSQ